MLSMLSSWWKGGAPPAATAPATASTAELPRERTIHDRIPRKVALTDLVNGSDRAHLLACLEEKGFAVISLPPADDTSNQSSQSIIDALYHEAGTFFALPEEQRLESRQAEGLNLGFVQCGAVREYLKLRPSDEASMWPTRLSGFRSAFDGVFGLLHDIAYRVFEEVAAATVSDMRNGTQRRLLDAPQVAAVSEFTPLKSNISLIHYFQTGSDETVCSCSEHKDTGLVTIIVAGTVPGLEVFDRSAKEWINVEHSVNPKDLLVILGEKIPAFGCATRFVGTLHRVMMPPHTERTSMVFLLDVAK